MSLKTLLAVGESFSKPEEKPFGTVKKDRQIPIFATTDEVSVEARAKKESQDLASSIPAELLDAPPELDFEKAETATPAKEEPARKVRVAPERRRIEQEPPERRQFLKRWSRPTIRTISQAEMELEQVRVVRNDLSDSDLELAPRRAARGPQKDLNPFAPRPIAAIGRPTHEKLGMGARVAHWFRFLKKPKN
jgi:hypothetical protein